MMRNKIERAYGIFLSGNRCVVCGWNKTDRNGNLLVIGAHVIRYSPENDKSNNIIGLCPNHHVEFDMGNLTIDYKNKRTCCYNELDEWHYKKLSGSVNHISPKFFIYHQREIFKKIV